MIPSLPAGVVVPEGAFAWRVELSDGRVETVIAERCYVMNPSGSLSFMAGQLGKDTMITSFAHGQWRRVDVYSVP